ncbi:MAG: hypothetical protein GY858_06775 [Candidatus Omnitrophica bacterium]|nr:hypothetical protein [Candidatus Omnitrophota bacterium]
MKKVTFMVAANYFVRALELLQKMGVVHLAHTHEPLADGITAIERRIAHIEKALNIFSTTKSDKQPKQKNLDKEKLFSSAKKIIELHARQQDHKQNLNALVKELHWFECWGNVSKTSLSELIAGEVFIKLYNCPKSLFKKLPKDKIIYIIGRDKATLRVVLVSRSQEEALELQEVMAPQRKRHSVESKIITTKANLRRINDKLKSLLIYKNAFIKLKEELSKRKEFYQARFGAERREGFCCVGGYCPQDSLEALKEVAKKERWGYLFQEPDDYEKTPTLIKTPKWIKIINPVFRLMGTIPGYQEFDISFWFLLFFTIFVAMLIGDAGYGFLFLFAVVFMHRKIPKLPRQVCYLFYLLSGATIFWGAVTGTWFGAERIAQFSLFSKLTIPAIATFSPRDNQSFIVHLCFLLGAVHLTVAHLMVISRSLNSLRALAQIGWMCIVWGLYYYCEMFVLNKTLPAAANMLLMSGFILALLFSSIHKGFIKGIGATLSDLPLNIIASFSDVMSYLRIFAVGFATVAMAVSVNGMAKEASGIASNVILKGFLVSIILFVGHAINIALAMMGVLVHGVRLNLLEFSSHLGMEWTGIAYKPFKE